MNRDQTMVGVGLSQIPTRDLWRLKKKLDRDDPILMSGPIRDGRYG